ncbi:hypothetical protein BD626DRAFT_569299 [Schizophyllum amplum]|uniref:AAA-ATPase-like domain-containing protein n=1 Tax=Schizophyllum amplum TaxID=97359 RepID=A0A550CEP9_9AGAR|nr:hypothetical protein BD626DRAFT_569299 [Auriculariopsis ampla]
MSSPEYLILGLVHHPKDTLTRDPILKLRTSNLEDRDRVADEILYSLKEFHEGICTQAECPFRVDAEFFIPVINVPPAGAEAKGLLDAFSVTRNTFASFPIAVRVGQLASLWSNTMGLHAIFTMTRSNKLKRARSLLEAGSPVSGQPNPLDDGSPVTVLPDPLDAGTPITVLPDAPDAEASELDQSVSLQICDVTPVQSGPGRVFQIQRSGPASTVLGSVLQTRSFVELLHPKNVNALIFDPTIHIVRICERFGHEWMLRLCRPLGTGKTTFALFLAQFHDISYSTQFASIFGAMDAGKTPDVLHSQHHILFLDFEAMSTSFGSLTPSRADVSRFERNISTVLLSAIDVFCSRYQYICEGVDLDDLDHGVKSFVVFLDSLRKTKKSVLAIVDNIDLPLLPVHLADVGHIENEHPCHTLSAILSRTVVRPLILAHEMEGPVKKIMFLEALPVVLDLIRDKHQCTSLNNNTLQTDDMFQDLCRGISGHQLSAYHARAQELGVSIPLSQKMTQLLFRHIGSFHPSLSEAAHVSILMHWLDHMRDVVGELKSTGFDELVKSARHFNKHSDLQSGLVRVIAIHLAPRIGPAAVKLVRDVSREKQVYIPTSDLDCVYNHASATSAQPKLSDMLSLLHAAGLIIYATAVTESGSPSRVMIKPLASVSPIKQYFEDVVASDFAALHPPHRLCELIERAGESRPIPQQLAKEIHPNAEKDVRNSIVAILKCTTASHVTPELCVYRDSTRGPYDKLKQMDIVLSCILGRRIIIFELKMIPMDQLQKANNRTYAALYQELKAARFGTGAKNSSENTLRCWVWQGNIPKKTPTGENVTMTIKQLHIEASTQVRGYYHTLNDKPATYLNDRFDNEGRPRVRKEDSDEPYTVETWVIIHLGFRSWVTRVGRPRSVNWRLVHVQE